MGELNAAHLLLESTVFHEGTHYGTGVSGVDKFKKMGKEVGKEFEKVAYGEDISDTIADRRTNTEMKPLQMRTISSIPLPEVSPEPKP